LLILKIIDLETSYHQLKGLQNPFELFLINHQFGNLINLQLLLIVYSKIMKKNILMNPLNKIKDSITKIKNSEKIF